MNPEESFSLRRLLAWLADDPLEAGEKYVRFQHELVEYVRRSGGHTVAEELTDEAFDRVDKRLAVSLLNEHYNSTEIADVPNLCRILADGAAKSLPGPGRRIWELLSPDDQSLVSEIAQAGTFDRHQRSRISEALNKMLSRRDFYRAEDFNSPAFQAEVNKNPKIKNIEAALTRGLPHLSQSEIEQFNRRLLEAAFPLLIKTNLADTPEAEKLARCKRYARNVLLEYQKEPQFFKPPITESGESKPEDAHEDTTQNNPYELIAEVEDEEEKRRLLAYLLECKRKYLSPRDSEIFDLYFTGIIIRSPDDEPLTDREIKEVRKTLAARYGAPPETIRTIAHRSKQAVSLCIERRIKAAD